MIDCGNLHVPPAVMQHVVHVESSFNPYAIGVVKGRLTRQPRNLQEALQTVKMLEAGGYNFSVGIAQVIFLQKTIGERLLVVIILETLLRDIDMDMYKKSLIL